MATSPRPSRSKREEPIAVKVVSSSRRIQRPSVTPPPIEPPKPVVQPVRQPAQPMSSQQRQRIMWWSVAVGTVIIVTAWLLTIRYELQPGHSSANIFSDIVRSFRSLKLSQPKPTPKQEEVHKYEQQVFPQFSNTNS